MLSKLVPPTTSPLTKAVRTLEGVLVILFNLAMVVIPIVTSSLPPATAVKYAAWVNLGLLISRGAIKGLASVKAPSLLSAGQIGQLELTAEDLSHLAPQVLSQIASDIKSGKLDPTTVGLQIVQDSGEVKKVVGDVTDPQQWLAARQTGDVAHLAPGFTPPAASTAPAVLGVPSPESAPKPENVAQTPPAAETTGGQV